MKRVEYILLNVKSIRMPVTQRTCVIVLVVLIIIGAGILIFSGNLNYFSSSQTSFRTPTGAVNIHVPLPDTPLNLTRYHVIPQENDTAYFSVNNLEHVRNNVTSVDDVPLVVPKALENYGGLPKDALMVYAETRYLEQIEDSGIPFIPSRVIAKSPISTDVQYGRKSMEFRSPVMAVLLKSSSETMGNCSI